MKKVKFDEIRCEDIPADTPPDQLDAVVDRLVRDWERRVTRALQIQGVRKLVSTGGLKKELGEKLIKKIKAKPLKNEPTPFIDGQLREVERRFKP